MDTCGVCRWSDSMVVLKFTRLIALSWSLEERRRLVETTAAAMLPRTPNS